MKSYGEHFDKAILYTLKNEDDNYQAMRPAVDEHDGGGLTRLGLTTVYDAKYFPAGKSIDDLTLDDIVEIYWTKYWNPLYSEIKDYKVAAKLFDFGVNRGVERSVKTIQHALIALGKYTVVADGAFGRLTLAAVNECDPVKLYREFINECLIQYNGIINKNPAKKVFYKGWLNRLYREP